MWGIADGAARTPALQQRCAPGHRGHARSGAAHARGARERLAAPAGAHSLVGRRGAPLVRQPVQRAETAPPLGWNRLPPPPAAAAQGTPVHGDSLPLAALGRPVRAARQRIQLPADFAPPPYRQSASGNGLPAPVPAPQTALGVPVQCVRLHIRTAAATPLCSSPSSEVVHQPELRHWRIWTSSPLVYAVTASSAPSASISTGKVSKPSPSPKRTGQIGSGFSSVVCE
jgi:hypothetical protein